MERRKRNILVLLFASMLILAIDLVPHHHHHGVPCWQPVKKEAGACSSSQNGCGCIGTFYASSRIDDTLHAFYCNHLPAVILLPEVLTSCSFIPERAFFPGYPDYTESLFDPHLLGAFGLRAPPLFVV